VSDEIAFGLQNLGLPRREITMKVKRAWMSLGITHGDRLPTSSRQANNQRGSINRSAIRGSWLEDASDHQLDPPRR